MSDPFDPYYTWLGIRPEEQPPNHYRLLGLQLFEDNLDAIEHAADRQMAHLRTLQTGKHAELSQSLLNEVAQAKLCLLNAEKKAAYDAILWEQVAEQAATVPAAFGARSATTPSTAILVEKRRVDRQSPAMSPRRPRQPPLPTVRFLLTGPAILAAILGGLWWAWPTTPGPSVTAVAQPSAIALPQPIKRRHPAGGSSSNAVRSAASGALLLDQWTDLFPRIDLTRDVVCGQWQRRGDAIHVGGYPEWAEDGFSRMMLPVPLEGSYDLEVQVARENSHSWAALLLPVGLQNCTVLLGVDHTAMLTLVDGYPVSGSPMRQTNESAKGRPCVVRVGVRLQGANAAVDVLGDGKPLLQWSGEQRSLSCTANWGLPEAGRFGLGGVMAAFHRVRLRPTRDVAAVASTASEATTEGESLPVGEWVDLLQFADVDWGRVQGEWNRRGDELVAGCVKWSPAGHPRIALPTEVQGSYDFEVEFTRTKGPFIVATILPVGLRHVTMLFDQGTPPDKVSGLEPIDRKTARDNPTSKRGPPVLTNEQRYVVLHQVRLDGDRARIEVFLNGQPFLLWSGTLEQLTENGQWSLPARNLPGLAATDCGAVFHAVRLRLVAGKATRVAVAGKTK
jgi:hypothetical protein